MTAAKKPSSRRGVFDASFSDFSLNMNTPEKFYIGEDSNFTFPRLDDFSALILSLGRGCFLWKRDLHRFFLQLPLDPYDYDKVGCIWRGELFIFTSEIWGCRHAGLNGQQVTNLVTEIHRNLGRNSGCVHTSDSLKLLCPNSDSNCFSSPFNVLNDDLAGTEKEYGRAVQSFNILGDLLDSLGLAESKDKAVAPTQILTYLGVEFDTLALEMRVNSKKLGELNTDLQAWSRRTVATKQELQSILGKLMCEVFKVFCEQNYF